MRLRQSVAGTVRLLRACYCAWEPPSCPPPSEIATSAANWPRRLELVTSSLPGRCARQPPLTPCRPCFCPSTVLPSRSGEDAPSAPERLETWQLRPCAHHSLLCQGLTEIVGQEAPLASRTAACPPPPLPTAAALTACAIFGDLLRSLQRSASLRLARTRLAPQQAANPPPSALPRPQQTLSALLQRRRAMAPSRQQLPSEPRKQRRRLARLRLAAFRQLPPPLAPRRRVRTGQPQPQLAPAVAAVRQGSLSRARLPCP